MVFYFGQAGKYFFRGPAGWGGDSISFASRPAEGSGYYSFRGRGQDSIFSPGRLAGVEIVFLFRGLGQDRILLEIRPPRGQDSIFWVSNKKSFPFEKNTIPP